MNKLTSSLLAAGMTLASVSALAAHHEKKDGVKEGDKKEMMDKDMKKDHKMDEKMKTDAAQGGVRKEDMKKGEMKK